MCVLFFNFGNNQVQVLESILQTHYKGYLNEHPKSLWAVRSLGLR